MHERVLIHHARIHQPLEAVTMPSVELYQIHGLSELIICKNTKNNRENQILSNKITDIQDLKYNEHSKPLIISCRLLRIIIKKVHCLSVWLFN